MAEATDTDLQKLLDRAARLQKRIAFRNDGTKALNARLEKLKAEIAVLVPESPQAADAAKETKGGGTSWTLAAAGGATVRVTQPAAKLLARISGELVEQLKKLCGRKFAKLFVPHFTCVKDLRIEAYKQLPDKQTAAAVIKLCEEQSKPTVTITNE